MPPASGNTFVIGPSKATPYYFGKYNCVDKAPVHPNPQPCDDSASGLYGLDQPPGLQVTLDNRFAPVKPFPPCVKSGRIKLWVFGLAGPDEARKFPVPVSVGTDPLLNRPSWVQAPYDGGECAP